MCREATHLVAEELEVRSHAIAVDLPPATPSEVVQAIVKHRDELAPLLQSVIGPQISQSGLCRVVIDLDAIASNFEAIRRRTRARKVLAVIKADAYGHGSIEVGRELCKLGIDFLGVSYLDEAMALREAGIKVPILVLQGVLPKHARLIVTHDLTPIVFEEAILEPLDAAARSRQRRVSIHIKVDSGMSRLGVLPADLPKLLEAVSRYPSIRLEGVMSHFAAAEHPDHELTLRQKDIFHNALKLVGPGVMGHVANSAAVLLDSEGRHDLVRPGLALYGVHPSSATRSLIDLRPAMSWSSTLVQVKTVPAGSFVSYGVNCRLARATRLGVVPAGYSDGMPRAASDGHGFVLVRGQRCPIVGRVCMDMTVVDLTDVPDAVSADDVVMLGCQGDAVISADDIAAWTGTIPHDIMCNIGTRAPKLYIRSEREPNAPVPELFGSD